MGLDIYFYRVSGVDKDLFLNSDDGIIEILNTEEDVYFRKANFLYSYFAEYIDPVNQWCVVSKRDIENLRDVCKFVADNRGDENIAKVRLPTRAGLFFGSTEYDDRYYDSIEWCYKHMDDLLAFSNEDDNYVIWFSW